MFSTVGLWGTAIGVALVVTVVVAVLLYLIIRTAKDIETTVEQIWVNGQRVANNTIHIPALYRTAETAEAIVGGVGLILTDAEAIAIHAETCNGCPACIVGGRA